MSRARLAERKRKRLDAGIEKLDLERPVFNRSLLADQLIQTIAVDDAVALLVDVHTRIVERRSAVEQYAKTHGLAARLRTKHEMEIARVKAKDDLAVRLCRESLLLPDVPPALEPPLVDVQSSRSRVAFVVVALDVFRGGPVFLSQVADVGLGRSDGAEVRRRLRAACVHLHVAARGRRVRVVLVQQLLDDVLRFLIVAFPEMMMADPALPVDEVVRWPVAILERIPDRSIAVDGDRIGELEILHGLRDVALVA